MIKELHRQGLSISDIARRTGRDRKTVRAALQAPVLPKPKARSKRERKI